MLGYDLHEPLRHDKRQFHAWFLRFLLHVHRWSYEISPGKTSNSKSRTRHDMTCEIRLPLSSTKSAARHWTLPEAWFHVAYNNNEMSSSWIVTKLVRQNTSAEVTRIMASNEKRRAWATSSRREKQFSLLRAFTKIHVARMSLRTLSRRDRGLWLAQSTRTTNVRCDRRKRKQPPKCLDSWSSSGCRLLLRRSPEDKVVVKSSSWSRSMRNASSQNW